MIVSSSAYVQIACVDFSSTLQFFTSSPLKFKIEYIFPADDPLEAKLFGYDLKLLLSKTLNNDTTTLCFEVDQNEIEVICGEDSQEIVAPNGTKVRLLPRQSQGAVFRPTLQESVVQSHLTSNISSIQISSSDVAPVWTVGRAGMRYRDLIPNRLGGRYIASHIHIPEGGPVPDYVHFHQIYFQMIFCYKGWVRVVYEDQGEPFLLHPGDCVLQPPQIRHRVLEASDNLEVIEIGSPAIHKTLQDFQLTLPSAGVDLQRQFDGQRFVRHVQDNWKTSLNESFLKMEKWGFCKDVWEVRETGICEASNGVASVQVIRAVGGGEDVSPPIHLYSTHASDLYFLFVLKGFICCSLLISDKPVEDIALHAGSSVTIPASTPFSLSSWSSDVEILEVEVFR